MSSPPAVSRSQLFLAGFRNPWRILPAREQRWIASTAIACVTLLGTSWAVRSRGSVDHMPASPAVTLATQTAERSVAATAPMHRAPRFGSEPERGARDLLVGRVLQDATSWLPRLGLSLRSLAMQGPPSNNSPIRHVDWTGEVIGKYPEVKIWLRELLARHHHLAVVAVDIRTSTDKPGEVDATVTFRFFDFGNRSPPEMARDPSSK